MKIQSLSIVVPNKQCVNSCPFCVSRMVNSNTYPNKMDINDPHYDINVKQYLKCLKYVSSLGCNTAMLTGTSEPQQNKQFLNTFALLHELVGKPFANIEMQTTGMFLTGNRDYIRFLRNFVGVNTIALSINSIDDDVNNEVLGHSNDNYKVNLRELCALLKEYDFNLRFCYNLSGKMTCSIRDTIDFAKENGANQITYRKLYASDEDTPQSKWIVENPIQSQFGWINNCLERYPSIGHTIYGAIIKDVEGMSVIYDTDCMGKDQVGAAMKYLILRPNCKLYSSWESPASLVF